MKEFFCDLHTHSINSDGKYSIQELINLAKNNNIRFLAITDHNKLIPDFELFQKNNPEIVLIQGSEISSIFKFSITGRQTELHIVGLFLQPTDELQHFLSCNNYNDKKRIEKMIQNLKKYGMNFDYEKLQSMYHTKHIGRMQLAQAMTEEGFVESTEVALDQFIGDYGLRLAWEPSTAKFASFEKVIEIIHLAGGLAVLAHPLRYGLTEKEIKELFIKFKLNGGDAVELFHASHSKTEIQALKKYIDMYNFGYSCGSDFHGFGNSENLNHCFPAEIYYQLQRLSKKLF